MKAIVESTYLLRGTHISTYASFPVYSDHIEETMFRHLGFLQKQGSDFTLTLKIVKNSS